MPSSNSDTLRALAAGDFSRLVQRFAQVGFQASQPARGVMQVCANGQARRRLLLSVGVHGDETAPVEMLAALLERLEPAALAVDLLLVVGNLDAIAQGKRFIEIDLNRLFGRDNIGNLLEERRANEIREAVGAFFGGGESEKWHLDLHTAIRASHHQTFAVVPLAENDSRTSCLLGLLGHAGIEAAILNPAPAGTFSSHTAQAYGAASATLELGQVAAMGSNDLSRFAAVQATLEYFLCSGSVPDGAAEPQLFRVVQELVKHSDAFRMHIGCDTWNFTAFAPGSLLAEDAGVVYRAGEREEYVVFPNPDVRKGFRAGLMVARIA